MKRKTTHQHVVFQEPGRPKKVDRVEKPVDDSKKYWFTRRDIHKFAADGSEKRNKKKFELMELMRLGAMPVKSLKTPLPILRGMRKKAVDRTVKERDQEIEAGTYDKTKNTAKLAAFTQIDPLVRAAKPINDLRQLQFERGRRHGEVEADRGMTASVGTFKNGVLHVNVKDPTGELAAERKRMRGSRDADERNNSVKSFKKFDKRRAGVTGGKKKTKSGKRKGKR